MKTIQFEIQAEWGVSPDKVDFTWEAMNKLAQDVPKMVQDYLKMGNDDVKRQALGTAQFNYQ